MNPLAPLVALGLKLSVKVAAMAATGLASAHVAVAKGLAGAEGKLIKEAQPAVGAGLAAAGQLAARAPGALAHASGSLVTRLLGRF